MEGNPEVQQLNEASSSSTFKSEELYNSEPRVEEQKEEIGDIIQRKIGESMGDLEAKFTIQISSLMDLIQENQKLLLS